MARGRVVLTASDRDVSVTLTFRSGVVEIRDGADPDAPVVAAPWLSMANICSGRTSPQAAWWDGDLRVRRLARSPLATAAASFVLSVPAAFYEDADTGTTPSRPAGIRSWAVDHPVFVLAAVLGALGLIWFTRRR
jgi:hypothetical protein